MPHYLSPDSRLRLPDVEETLDIGHAIHASGDPELKGTLDQKLAIEIVKEFIALKAINDDEVPYLRAIKSIARSYGRALTRRKKIYLEQLEAAREERDRKQSLISGKKLVAQGWQVVWKFLAPVILALSGFLVARILGGIVPVSVSEKTGENLPAALMSLAFLFVGRMVKQWYDDRQRARVTSEYSARCYMAFSEYETGKLREFTLWRQRLIEEWETYTNAKYTNKASYQMIMRGDIEARRKFEEHVKAHNMTDIQRISAIAKRLVSRFGQKSA